VANAKGIRAGKRVSRARCCTSASRSYGYLHQMAFYRALIFQATGVVVPVSRARVESTTTAPYSVFDLVSGFTNAVDRHLRQTRSRNDIRNT
jgi:hypothetical protein